MQLRAKILLQGEMVQEEYIALPAEKFEELNAEEKEAAIEAILRDWFNQNIAIEWELQE